MKDFLFNTVIAIFIFVTIAVVARTEYLKGAENQRLTIEKQLLELNVGYYEEGVFMIRCIKEPDIEAAYQENISLDTPKKRKIR